MAANLLYVQDERQESAVLNFQEKSALDVPIMQVLWLVV
jgi:hypothetical protein